MLTVSTPENRESVFELAFAEYIKLCLCLGVDKPNFAISVLKAECDLLHKDIVSLYNSRKGENLTIAEYEACIAAVAFFREELRSYGKKTTSLH